MDEVVASPSRGSRPRLGRPAFVALLVVLAATATIGATTIDTSPHVEESSGVDRVADEIPVGPPTPPTVSLGTATTDEATTTTLVSGARSPLSRPTTTAPSPTTSVAGPLSPPSTTPIAPPSPSTSPLPTPTATPSTTPTTTPTPTSTTTPTSTPATAPTTTPTTPPTTTPPPTTTLPSGSFSQAYLSSNGAGPAAWLLPTSAALAHDALPNYDTDHDADPGRTIVRSAADGGGPTRDQAQLWSVPVDEPYHAVGTPRVELWAAATGFEPGVRRLEVALAHCWGYLTCEGLSTKTAGFDQSDFGRGFGRVTVSMPPIDVAVPAGHYFVIGVTVPSSSEGDVWVAFDSTSYPSRAFLD